MLWLEQLTHLQYAGLLIKIKVFDKTKQCCAQPLAEHCSFANARPG